MQTRFLREHTAVLCLAAAAVVVIVARACLQNITIDEASSYLVFASPSMPRSHWHPSSGNHVLNSILMRLATLAFGISELTVRLPAILGALIYITSSAYICLLITSRKLIQVPLFICLVYNPMILDYLVAARGYSLAIAFLLAALAVIANIMIEREPGDMTAVRRKCAWASAFLALSFSANFSFAIADATTILLFFLWMAVQNRRSGRSGSVRLAVSCFLPGIVIAFGLCGSVLLAWPKGQLYFGSRSLSEMWSGLRAATFDDPNPNMVNPALLRLLDEIRTLLPYITLLTLMLLLASIELGRWRARIPRASGVSGWRSLLDVLLGDATGGPGTDGLLAFTRLSVAIAVTTLLLHWIAFSWMQLLLPQTRTGLFFVAFWTLVFGSAVALRLRKARWDVAGSFGVAVLIVVALYFAGCLRLTYFREWKFDLDTKQVYWTVYNLHRRCGITDFGTNFRYHMSMNFYRTAYGHYILKEFPPSSDRKLPDNRSACVIFFPESEEFIQQQRPQVVYRNDDSGSGVVIRGCAANARPND